MANSQRIHKRKNHNFSLLRRRLEGESLTLQVKFLETLRDIGFIPEMRISRRAEYALRALLLFARDAQEKVHQIQELSDRGKIPVKFLEQILLTLRNEGLLTSKRGVGGGYSLRRRPSEMIVLDIVELLDGPIAPLPCALERPGEPCGCFDPIHCPLRPLMREARQLIRNLFGAKTIQDLADESRDEQIIAYDI